MKKMSIIPNMPILPKIQTKANETAESVYKKHVNDRRKKNKRVKKQKQKTRRKHRKK